ncbi:MAG: diacylglycerol kinase family protein [Bacteroidales bacterium]|nr:diacylglycerol kinase family protein [Bacteroidales bacterium]
MHRTIWGHIKRRLKSFKYAFQGLFYVFRTQTNMQIHAFAMILVVVVGVFFKISSSEWLFITLAVALVMVSEIVNTAIEEIVNFISPDFHKQAGLIKDLGAAFVLLAAIFAIVVGIIIFLPKFLLLFS